MPRPKTIATVMSCFLPMVAIGVLLLPFGNLNAQKLKQIPLTPAQPSPKGPLLPQADGWRPAFELPSSSPSKPSGKSPTVQKSAGSPRKPFAVPSINTPLAQLPAQIPAGKASANRAVLWFNRHEFHKPRLLKSYCNS